MLSKKKNEYYICSIFCRDLDDYPYFPFVAKNITDAVRKYSRFNLNSDKICPNPELHIIGTCCVDENGSLYKIQRNFYVYHIDLGSFQAKRIYDSTCLEKKVSESLDRFFLKWREFCQVLQKNLKICLMLKKEN